MRSLKHTFSEHSSPISCINPPPSPLNSASRSIPPSIPRRIITSLIGPNFPVSSPPFLFPPTIVPRPAGVTKPPPSESGRFLRFSTLTCKGLAIPDPSAPRPDPLVQPYFESSRSAKPFWPGRRERGSFSLLSFCTSLSFSFSGGSSLAKTSSSSASDAGISAGAGGRV